MKVRAFLNQILYSNNSTFSEVSDHERDAQLSEKEAIWTFGEWVNNKPEFCEEAYVV
jgi:hypothetical protein